MVQLSFLLIMEVYLTSVLPFGWLVCCSVCHEILNGRKLTLPCSYQSTSYQSISIIITSRTQCVSGKTRRASPCGPSAATSPSARRAPSRTLSTPGINCYCVTKIRGCVCEAEPKNLRIVCRQSKRPKSSIGIFFLSKGLNDEMIIIKN